MKQITQHEPPDLREPHVAASAFESAHQGRHHADSSPTCKPTGAVQWSGGGNYATAHIPVLACRLVSFSKREWPRSSDRVSCRNGSRQRNWLDENCPVDVRLYARCDVRVVLWPFAVRLERGFCKSCCMAAPVCASACRTGSHVLPGVKLCFVALHCNMAGNFAVVGLTEFLVRFVEWGVLQAR